MKLLSGWIALSFALSGCLLPLPGTTPGGVQPADEAALAGAPSIPPNPATAVPEPAQRVHRSKAAKVSAPGMVEVRLENECRDKVRLFYGQKPKFAAGTYSSLSSRTHASKHLRRGETIWLVDDKDNGLASVTIGDAARENVTVDCASIASR